MLNFIFDIYFFIEKSISNIKKCIIMNKSDIDKKLYR